MSRVSRPKKDILIKFSNLGRFELWHCKKGFPYEVRLQGGRGDSCYGSMKREDSEKFMYDAEHGTFPALSQLKLHEMEVIKLSKKRLKKLIFQAYKDNFDRIKKLKEYEVIK